MSKSYTRLILVAGLTILYAIIAINLPEYIHPNQLIRAGMYIEDSNDLYSYIFGTTALIHFVFSIYYLRNCNVGESSFITIFAFSVALTMICVFLTQNALNIISVYDIQYHKVDEVKVVDKSSYRGTGKQQTMSYYCTIKYKNGAERRIGISSEALWKGLKEEMPVAIYHYKGRLSNVEEFIFNNKR